MADILLTATSAELNYSTGVTSAIQTQLGTKVTANSAITWATKTKVTYDTKGLVTAGTDATTADVADSTNRRYITDAQLVVVGNTSWTNTGDQTTIVWITGTKAQFDTACSDGNFAYQSDLASYLVSGWALGTPSSWTLTNATWLPISWLVASTSTVIGVWSVELWHATDTTITRVSAGLIAVEWVTLVDVSATQTLTNKTLTSPTLTTPALWTPASGNLWSCTADWTDQVGFKNIPQNSKSAAYTTVLWDSGKHIYHPSADTTARTWTIDSNANVAYPIGTAITFINDTSWWVITIAITSDTMILAWAWTTGSRTLAANGIATAIKMTSTRRIISWTWLT